MIVRVTAAERLPLLLTEKVMLYRPGTAICRLQPPSPTALNKYLAIAKENFMDLFFFCLVTIFVLVCRSGSFFGTGHRLEKRALHCMCSPLLIELCCMHPHNATTKARALNPQECCTPTGFLLWQPEKLDHCVYSYNLIVNAMKDLLWT